MVVVFGGFALADVVFIKGIGVGLAIAVAVDATIVRILLVPAIMRLMGTWNWWAPKPVAAFTRRLGLGEHTEPDPVSVRIPAKPDGLSPSAAVRVEAEDD